MAKAGGEKIKIVVLVVITLIGLGFIIRQLIPPRPTFTQILVDVEARKIFAQELVAGVEFPTTSPYSPGRNAYLAHECIGCGAIFSIIPFIPTTEEEIAEMMEDPMAMIPRCPTCGSKELTIPTIPEGQEFIRVDQEEIPIAIMRP